MQNSEKAQGKLWAFLKLRMANCEVRILAIRYEASNLIINLELRVS